MYRDHLNTDTFKSFGQSQCIFFCVAPTGAHLQSHRHAARCTSCHNSLCNFNGQALVLHERRTRPLVTHFFSRAAHVDVNDLRTLVDVVGRCFGHHGRIGAGNLHSDGARLALVIGTPRCFQAFPQVLARRHHLAHGIARTKLSAQLAKGSICDTRHGGYED